MENNAISNNTVPFHDAMAVLLNAQDSDHFAISTARGRNSALATLACAAIVITSTKVPDERANLAPIISGFEAAAKNLDIGSNIWITNLLTALKARTDGYVVQDLKPFDQSIVTVMKNIKTRDDMITRLDASPEQAFEFLSALLGMSDLPDDKIEYVLDVYTGLAQHLNFEVSVPFDATKQTFIDRLDALTAPDDVGDNDGHDVVGASVMTGHPDSAAANQVVAAGE